MFFDDKLHLTFDDVCLVTGLTTVKSRSEIDLTSHLPKGYSLELPLMTAAMDTITSGPMAKAVIKEGGAIIHHRNQSVEDRVSLIEEMKSHPKVQNKKAINGVAVGLNASPSEIEDLIQVGANLICLEVAHAYLDKVVETVHRIGPICQRENVLFMVGNFSSIEAIKWLKTETNNLVDIVKVSQGGGSVCTTRIVTGIGKPTLQAVIDLIEAEVPYHVVADGGIRSSGALAKALGAGACAGMLGGLLSGTEETPGRVVTKDSKESGGTSRSGELFKEFRGMASSGAKEAINAKIKNVEGISTLVPYRGPVKPILDQIRDGLQSSVASTGFTSMTEFQKEAQFIRVSHSSQLESYPHAKLLKGE